MRTVYLVALFFWGVPGMLFAQRLPESGLYRVHIDRQGFRADAEVQPLARMPKVREDRWYYWFAAGEIRHTQGGFSGKLLNGPYHSYFDEGSPQESGRYEAGLRQGTWKSWNSNGTLSQVTTWSDGIRSGAFSLYDEAGRLRQQGHYRNDLLEGAVSANPGTDSARLTYYHKGAVIEHRSFLKRLPFINRHKRDTTDHVQR